MEAIVTVKELPLIVIVGPTASGKTSLAIRLAKQYDGEIISADSRAVYRGLDVATAKPTSAEQGGVPHWGIDLVSPNERFTVVDFQEYTRQRIQEIRARGHVPFLVGGTGLYIDSVLYSYEFIERTDDVARRDELQSLSIEALHEYCRKNNIDLPQNVLNKRYVVNNILRHGQQHKRDVELPSNTIVVGIATEKSILWSRIAHRVEQMWRAGIIDETRRIAEIYGWESEAMTGNAYRVVREYLEGTRTEGEALEKMAALDRQLAKRQLTWFRRDEHIVWLDQDDAYTYIAQVLSASLNS